MSGTPETLLDDWRNRRAWLSSAAARTEQLADLQVRILDYLIRRYGDSPEAARPARTGPRHALYVNQRAIVVHAHLWQGKVGGAKTREEAEARVARLLRRLTTPECTAPDAELAWDWVKLTAPCPDPDEPSPRTIGRCYRRLLDPECQDDGAVDVLARPDHRVALLHAVLAWRQRLRAGCRDRVTRRLQIRLRSPQIGWRVGDLMRECLADDHPLVRLQATFVLARVGTLEDIGLLSDLLALPPSADEHPRERAAQAWAMQKIAEAGR